ncbi:MAG: tetratricopeptide repeat protein [Candidatus Krumholzibacteria bacterium]|nr:tetratricopeptide repeat protein [Candidatus Krumholzibacteria bacterium]
MTRRLRLRLMAGYDGWVAIVTVVLAAVTLVLPRTSLADDLDLFAQGNQMYEAGDFEGAVEAYQSVVANGIISSDLFYNLANAYYKLDDLGRAVLNYKRALRMAPRDADARSNLLLVQSMLRDKHFVEEPGFVKQSVTWLYRRLSARESIVITSLLYLALALVVVVFIFRDTSFVSTLYPKLSMVSPGRFLGLDKSQDFVLAMATLMVLLSASATASYSKYHTESSKRQAIIVEEEVPVYGSPSGESTLQFKVHEGTRVTTGQTRPGWVQIRLPGDLEGWISNSSIERI